jgi:hypothetical protein
VIRTNRVADALGQLGHREDSQLRAAAEAEARRIGELRALSHTPRDSARDDRPPLTILRRRTWHHVDLWGFHITFADSSDQLVWQTLLGAVDRRSRADRPLESLKTTIASALEHQRQTMYALLEHSLHAYVERAIRRERALADALDQERARLSATLLQRGLFDRRAERAFDAQRAVLEEGLLRCRVRLDELAATSRLVAEPARLAFVLIRR